MYCVKKRNMLLYWSQKKLTQKTKSLNHMSHFITKPYDVVYSNQGKEWHGLATVISDINKDTAKDIIFPIVEAPIFGEVVTGKDTHRVSMENGKILIADLRHRTDLPEKFVALHTPKNGYAAYDNSQAWPMVEEILSRIPGASVTTAGTLRKLKRFFVTIAIPQDVNVQGDTFKPFLNLMLGHDGVLGIKLKGGITRIVCANTEAMALGERGEGEVDLTAYHTQNGVAKADTFAELSSNILTGITHFIEETGKLMDTACTPVNAERITAGFMVAPNGVLSTRAKNQTDEILNLFANGRGNNGRTMADLLHGVTEYWTLGNGNGSKASLGERHAKGMFSDSLNAKEAFRSILLSKTTREKVADKGKKALIEYASAS